MELCFTAKQNRVVYSPLGMVVLIRVCSFIHIFTIDLDQKL